jgi:hypothetical protein
LHIVGGIPHRCCAVRQPRLLEPFQRGIQKFRNNRLGLTAFADLCSRRSRSAGLVRVVLRGEDAGRHRARQPERQKQYACMHRSLPAATC